jgi:MoxR-like ATPase
MISISHCRTHATAYALAVGLFDRITSEIGKIFVGQQELVLGSLVALFSSGHVLIESVPGLGKTLFVRTLGRVLGCHFGRIQFTADLMPSDITGAPIFDMKTQEFRFRPGPVFTQLLLADEINRSPAKTHAALLEIMQEYRVTIDGKSHKLSARSWCWRRRTRSNRRAPTICPKRSWTGSCSSWWPIIRGPRRRRGSWRCTACRSI